MFFSKLLSSYYCGDIESISCTSHNPKAFGSIWTCISFILMYVWLSSFLKFSTLGLMKKISLGGVIIITRFIMRRKKIEAKK